MLRVAFSDLISMKRFTFPLIYYRPQTTLRGGNVFTGICLFMGGGGVGTI